MINTPEETFRGEFDYLTAETRKRLERAARDIKIGKIISFDKVKQELGL